MSSNLYLFEANSTAAIPADKSELQIMRKAELARSLVSARILRNLWSNATSVFRTKKPTASTVSKTDHAGKAVHKDENRLAA